MTARVLIVGGYGSYGGRIARMLAPDRKLRLLIAGRSFEKARAFAATLDAAHAPEAHALDISKDLAAPLAALRPDVLIHTCGPFQGQDHRVARAAIAAGCHYLDLADGRAFVAGIGALDAAACDAGVLAVAGASSVPCLSAAVIDHHLPGFARLRRVDYGISVAQRAGPGEATAAGILGYLGKPFATLRGGRETTVHGWHELHAHTIPGLGRRLFGACDVPDLALFPARYPSLTDLRFGAGHEVAALHLGTWALAWLARAGLAPNLPRHAGALLRLAKLFDPFGSANSGFFMRLSGDGHDGRTREARFSLVARSGHGAHIPCVPAVLLAKRLARGLLAERGARPCLDLITLPQYLDALGPFDIAAQQEPTDA